MSFATSKGNKFPFCCCRAKACVARKNACMNPPPYETDDASTNLSDSMRVHSSGNQYKYKHKKKQKEIKSQYGPTKQHEHKKVTFEKLMGKSLVSLYRKNNNRGSSNKSGLEKMIQNLSERAQFGTLPRTLGLSAGDGKTLEYNENKNVKNTIKASRKKPRKTTKTDHEIKKMKGAHKTSSLKTSTDCLCANHSLINNKNDKKVLKNLDKIHVQRSEPVNKTLNKYFIKFDYVPRKKEHTRTFNQLTQRLSSGDANDTVKKKQEEKKKTNIYEKPKDNENLKHEQIIPYSLQSVCNLLQRLQLCVDKTKQEDPNYKGKDSLVTNKDEKLLSSSQNKKEKKHAKSKKKSNKNKKSKPEVKDICSDGVCADVDKDSSFTCKCVERKRPHTCNEMTCKVPLDEAGTLKGKIRCLCHKYSRQFKSMKLDDTEDSKNFCREDDKTFTLCREAYIKKHPNFKCSCKPKDYFKPKECTDKTCKITTEPPPSDTISLILTVVGKVLAETISKVDDCLKRKLACTISEKPEPSVDSVETNDSSKNVQSTKGRSEKENKKHKCVCNKQKKQNKKNSLRSPVTPEAITPGTFDNDPSTLERKSGIKGYLQCVHMKLCKKLQPFNKYKAKLLMFTQPINNSKYTNTMSPKTTLKKKGQIQQNNKRTMVYKVPFTNQPIQGFGSSVASDSVLPLSSPSICKCDHECQCNLITMKDKEKQKKKKKLEKMKPKQKKKKDINKTKQKPKPKPIQKPKPKRKKNDKAKLKKQQMKMKMRNKAEYGAVKLKQKEEAKVNKRLKKAHKENQKKQEKLRKQQIEQLISLTRGKTKAKETNFAVEFCTEVCKMIFGSAIAIVKAVFKLIFSPRKSIAYIKNSILNPASTKQSILNWKQGHMTLFKLKMEKAISGSEKMIIMEDTCKESPIYQKFAEKGKDEKERRQIELEKKQRTKRIAQRDRDALFGCRHILLTTLRRRPCMWIYHLCPNIYPQCLSLVIFWQNFSNLILFCLAMIFWTPCILVCELCRGLMCCTLCTA